jgi:hypothetical protein
MKDMDTESVPYAIEEFTEYMEQTMFRPAEDVSTVRVTGLETGKGGTMRKDTFERIQQACAEAGEPNSLKRACETVVYSAEKNAESSADHIWHVWINSINPWGNRDEEVPLPMLTHRRELYEWKRAMEEVGRLPGWLTRAWTGTLPTEHKQCSRSPVEELPDNHLIRALGVDVRACPILQSFYKTWSAETQRRYSNPDLTMAHADAVAARICVWHIFTRAIDGERTERRIDTSEGYMQDAGSRRFWENVYSNMSMVDDEG